MLFIFRARVCSPKTNAHYWMFGRLNTWLCGASLTAGKPLFDSHRLNTVYILYHLRKDEFSNTESHHTSCKSAIFKPSFRQLQAVVLILRRSFAPDMQHSFNAVNLQNNHFLHGAYGGEKYKLAKESYGFQWLLLLPSGLENIWKK